MDNTPLLWAANRDEFAHRATAHLQRWTHKNATIYSGLDLALESQDGLQGTWSGFNAAGRFAWLTNIRSPNDGNPHALSRGQLVSQFLAGDHHGPAEYLAAIKAKTHRYNGFNLVVGHIDANPALSQCWHYNARSKIAHPLGAGVYGLSNADLDTPWPKTQALVQALTLAAARPESSRNLLFDALKNPQTFPTHALPNTGLPLELEQTLSAAFIASEVRGSAYGTRSSTVGAVTHAQAHIEERSFDTSGMLVNTHTQAFNLTAHSLKNA